MATLRERKREQTKATIADVAIKLFLEHGFDAVFLTEHHMSTHNPFQNSLQFGSYLAPQLRRAASPAAS